MPWQSIHHQHGPSFGIDGSEDNTLIRRNVLKVALNAQCGV